MQGWTRGWCSPDSDAFADSFTPDAVYIDASFGGMATGDRISKVFWHDAFIQVFSEFDVQIQEGEVYPGGDVIAFRCRASGVMTGNLAQIPPGLEGYPTFTGEGDTVTLRAGKMFMSFTRGADGHFDMSALPSFAGSGKRFQVYENAVILRVNAQGLIEKAVETYDRLPMMKEVGQAF